MFGLRSSFLRRLASGSDVIRQPLIAHNKSTDGQPDELLMCMVDEEDGVSQLCTLIKSCIVGRQ